MYEKYFKEIVSTINKKIPSGAEGVFTWAAANAHNLYTQERTLDAELNALWDVDFEAFKAKVIAWGRVVLGIYKKFAEIKK